MGLSKLAMNKYVDEVVAYEFCNNKVIRYKSKQAGESDNLIWEIEKATSIEFIGALSQAKCHKLKEYIYQNCEYIESPLKELWVKDNIEIKGLEKEIKKNYYIIGKLPPGVTCKFWISQQIEEIKPAYEKQTL